MSQRYRLSTHIYRATLRERYKYLPQRFFTLAFVSTRTELGQNMFEKQRDGFKRVAFLRHCYKFMHCAEKAFCGIP